MRFRSLLCFRPVLTSPWVTVFSIFLSTCLMSKSFAQLNQKDATTDTESEEIKVVAQINTPSDDGWKLWINEQMGVSGSASKQISTDGGASWSAYSGGPAITYSWTATDGSFLESDVPSTTYVAPSSVANQAEDITLTLDASAPDATQNGHDQKNGQVGQIKIVAVQTGQVSGTYDPAILASEGGNTLGMTWWGHPTGATGFYGATECRATLPTGFTMTGDLWEQRMTGNITTNGVPGVPDNNAIDFTQGGIAGKFSVDGLNSWDNPGLKLNQNDPGNYIYNYTFSTYIKDGSNMVISNKASWTVDFEVKPVGGTETVQAGHVPA